MKIYVDLVIILNFIFDLILLMSVNYILRRNVNIGRLLLGSLVGSFTLLILFIKMNNLIMLLFKVLVSIFIIIVSFGFKDIKYTMKNITYFYLVSMLMGGGIEFLGNQFSYSNNGLVFNNTGLKISYSVVLIIGIFIFFKHIKMFKELKNNYGNYFKCKLFFNKDVIIELNAFLDTGNKLKDPYSDKSIILVDKEKIKGVEFKNPLYVPYNSLNNHGMLTCYKCLKLEIDGMSFDRFLIGISNEKFYMDGIDCIINNHVMEGLR